LEDVSGVSLFWLLVMGLVVGAIARLVVPGRHPLGILGTMAAGVLGALVGWWIGGQLVGEAQVRDDRWIWATIGSILVIFVFSLLTRRRSPLSRLRRRW
jgi:uncharacterized membrane protein YeaQ/YmgE (transglycosylase-associated protein family)